MKVKELIEELQRYSPEGTVLTARDDPQNMNKCMYVEITNIWVASFEKAAYRSEYIFSPAAEWTAIDSNPNK